MIDGDVTDTGSLQPSHVSCFSVLCVMLSVLSSSASPLFLLFSFCAFCLLTAVVLLDETTQNKGGKEEQSLQQQEQHNTLIHLQGGNRVTSAKLYSPYFYQRGKKSNTSSSNISLSASVAVPPSSVVPSSLPLSAFVLVGEKQLNDGDLLTSSPRRCCSAFPLPSAVRNLPDDFAPELRSLASSKHTHHYILTKVDDPLSFPGNPVLTGDTGKQLMQWMMAAHMALVFNASLMVGTIFPGHSDWDSLTGLLEGEKTEIWSLNEYPAFLDTRTLAQKNFHQLIDQMPNTLEAPEELPVIAELKEIQLELTDIPFFSHEQLIIQAQRKYCMARVYRPIIHDLFAGERYPVSRQHPVPFIVAISVYCESELTNRPIEQQRDIQCPPYIKTLPTLIQQLISLYKLSHMQKATPLPLLSFHLFVPDSLSAMHAHTAMAELIRHTDIQALQQSHQISIQFHLPPMIKQTLAIHHFITADWFVGDNKGPSLFAALIRPPSLTFLPTDYKAGHIISLAALAELITSNTTLEIKDRKMRTDKFRWMQECLVIAAQHAILTQSTSKGKGTINTQTTHNHTTHSHVAVG